MRNKQPWYHEAVVEFIRDTPVTLEEARRFFATVSFPGLVGGTWEVDPGQPPSDGPGSAIFELLFTATREIDSLRLRAAIEKEITQDPQHPVTVAVFTIEAEPGDPADLL